MANRVLRDWTASESIDKLSLEAEVFFTRLIMKVDDFGCYYGNPKLLKSHLYPLRDYSVDDIKRWRNECILAKVIIIYMFDEKEYLHIPNFGQRLRTMNSKFPKLENSTVLTIDSNPPTIDSKVRPELETETEGEVEDETETETETVADAVTLWPSFEDFWTLYDKKIDRPKCEKKWEKINQGAREKILEHLALYVRATPDRQYRKNPLTYLNNESWNNEIILPNGKHSEKGKSSAVDLAAALQERINQDARDRQFQSSG